ncbi:MAG: hypothetical protein GY899_16905 [Verrucomicrobiaceae bacterium]|nr:hypothetical protein [Verrucomicrobiaceae bacterium]
MSEEEKPARPKLIVPGAEGAEKKAKPLVAQEAESSKPQVILPQSSSSPGNKLVVEQESGASQMEVPLSQPSSPPESTPVIVSAEPEESAEVESQSAVPETKGDGSGSASPKVLVRPMISPAQGEISKGEEIIASEEEPEEVVDVGPPPEEDGIADIVGAIGVAEEVIAELDEVAEREERARIAEEQRLRAIQEANARAEEEQRAREEEQRARDEEEARIASQRRENEQSPPLGHVVPAQAGYPQQGYPGHYPGHPYPPPPPHGAAGEGMQVKAPSGIPGWALYLIGFLSGALILLILFMATPMGEGLISKSLVGKGWKPPVIRVQPSGGR